MLIQLNKSEPKRKQYISDAINIVLRFSEKYPDLKDFPEFGVLVELMQIINDAL